MSPSEIQTDRASDPGNRRSLAGETIAEVSFTLLLIGVWLVTCLSG